MKRAISIILILSLLCLSLTGCGQNYTSANGKTYGTYGLFNADTQKNPDIKYELCIGNLFWGIVLIETIIAPIYFFGFDLFNPIGEAQTFEPGVIK